MQGRLMRYARRISLTSALGRGEGYILQSSSTFSHAELLAGLSGRQFIENLFLRPS